MAREYRFITAQDRQQIAAFYSKGDTPYEIAKKLKVHPSTIYRELKRGRNGRLNKNGREVYNPQLAQQTIETSLQRKGRKSANRIQKKRDSPAREKEPFRRRSFGALFSCLTGKKRA